MSPRITAPCSGCPSSARSAPTASPIPATSSPRSPPMRTRTGEVELVQKYLGRLWTTTLDHCPLDVVAWHGNLAPWKYDLARFNAIGTVSFDHPDPSHLHRADQPVRDARPRQCRFRHLPAALDGRRGHVPAALVPPQRDERVHGPDPRRLRRQGRRLRAGRPSPAQPHVRPRPRRRQLEGRVRGRAKPHKIEDTLAFMVESCWPFRPTRFALEAARSRRITTGLGRLPEGAVGIGAYVRSPSLLGRGDRAKRVEG